MSLKISNLVETLHFFRPPTALWAIHLDPYEQFLAVVHTNLKDNNLFIDKSILLNETNGAMQLTITLNEDIVCLENYGLDIFTTDDLTMVTNCLENAKVCTEFNKSPTCLKYVLTAPDLNLCDLCYLDAVVANQHENNEETNFENAETKCYIEKEIKHLCDNDGDGNKILPSVKKKKISRHTYVCPICGKLLFFKSKLESHLLCHLPKPQKPYKCNFCYKSYSVKSNLNIHIRTHTGERPYMCSECGKTFASRGTFQCHIQAVHQKKATHVCEICGQRFLYPKYLESHMTEHTGTGYKCHFCGKVFGFKTRLKSHLRLHTGEKPIICQFCGKRFSHYSGRAIHMRKYCKERNKELT